MFRLGFFNFGCIIDVFSDFGKRFLVREIVIMFFRIGNKVDEYFFIIWVGIGFRILVLLVSVGSIFCICVFDGGIKYVNLRFGEGDWLMNDGSVLLGISLVLILLMW